MADLLDVPQPLAKAFTGAICDLDGVVFVGSQAVAKAAETIAAAEAAGLRLVYLTNNASRSPKEVADKLTGFGIGVNPAQVVTAAVAGATRLAADLPPGSNVLVVGHNGLIEAVSEAGLQPVFQAKDRPVAVIQGWGPNVGWAQLAQAAYAIQGGAKYYATNLDRTLPTEEGFAPGNAALISAVTMATGVSPMAGGKPDPAIFQLAAERAGTDRPLVIGDRLDTDLAGARAAGYPGLLVLTGVNTLVDACLAPPDHRPSLVARSIEALTCPHRAPVLSDGRWVLDGAAAWWDQAASAVRVQASPCADHMIRAVVQAAWDALDSGQPLTTSSLPTGLS